MFSASLVDQRSPSRSSGTRCGGAFIFVIKSVTFRNCPTFGARGERRVKDTTHTHENLRTVRAETLISSASKPSTFLRTVRGRGGQEAAAISGQGLGSPP